MVHFNNHYKTKWDPIECSLCCIFLYMFYIGLMMAELRPKHVAWMWTDILYFITVLIQSCVLTVIHLIVSKKKTVLAFGQRIRQCPVCLLTVYSCYLCLCGELKRFWNIHEHFAVGPWPVAVKRLSVFLLLICLDVFRARVCLVVLSNNTIGTARRKRRCTHLIFLFVSCQQLYVIRIKIISHFEITNSTQNENFMRKCQHIGRSW